MESIIVILSVIILVIAATSIYVLSNKTSSSNSLLLRSLVVNASIISIAFYIIPQRYIFNDNPMFDDKIPITLYSFIQSTNGDPNSPYPNYTWTEDTISIFIDSPKNAKENIAFKINASIEKENSSFMKGNKYHMELEVPPVLHKQDIKNFYVLQNDKKNIDFNWALTPSKYGEYVLTLNIGDYSKFLLPKHPVDKNGVLYPPSPLWQRFRRPGFGSSSNGSGYSIENAPYTYTGTTINIGDVVLSVSPESLKDSDGTGKYSIDLEGGKLTFPINVIPTEGVSKQTWFWYSTIGSIVAVILQSSLLIFVLERRERSIK
ncbi:MAG: hypothetical protein JAY74_00165 [Candidatus Thiodiazotropha taylori]|nr:hypothetical protein [Candidatus Thiodiazotropha taylori]